MTIDWWTLGIQTVNVVVLVWLLQKFFWRPVAAIVAQRQAAAEKIIADAEAQRARTAALAETVVQTRAGFAKEREAILAASHADAEAARTTLLDQSAKDAADARDAATATIAAERQAADTAWMVRSGTLGVDIAGRLAARLDGPAVRGAFLDWLVQAIHALPDAARAAIVAQHTSLDAVSATPLDQAEQARAEERIGKAFGTPTPIAFKTDPALIAGLELQAPHLIVGNSWRADLATILAGIQHGR